MEIFVNVGLTEAITHCHIATGLMPTYQRGSQHIDSIYTLIILTVSSDSYLSFGIILSDHSLILIKVELDSAFGTKMETLVSHTVQRLNSQKTDTIKRSIELYENFIRDNVLHLDPIPPYSKGWFMNPPNPSYKNK